MVKAIIFDRQDRVLILHRSEIERKKKNSHGFDFPGGGLEVGELMLDALSREVFEETGLAVEIIAPAYVYDELQAEKHLVIIKYACANPSGELILSDEHDQYEWVPLQQLANRCYPDWMQEEIWQAYRIYQTFSS